VFCILCSHFDFIGLHVLRFVSSVLAKRLAANSISEMDYFVSSEM